MKHSIFILLVLLCSLTFTANAQLEQGSVVLGADFPRLFSNFSRSGMKFNAGFFPVTNFSFGANLGLREQSLTDLNEEDITGLAVAASLVMRYYLPQPSDELRIFLQGEAGLDKTWAGDLEARYEFATGGMGVAYFVAENLSLEVTSKVLLSNEDDRLNFETPRWGLGIRYFIPAKRPE